MPENPAPEDQPKPAEVGADEVKPAIAEGLSNSVDPSASLEAEQQIAVAEAEGMVAPAQEGMVAPVQEEAMPVKPTEEAVASAKPAEEAVVPAKSAQSSQGDFLEETILPSTVENHDLKPGASVTWGELSFTVGNAALGGWYMAQPSGLAKQADTALLVKPGLDGNLLAGLGNHRLLPRVVYAGPEGVAVAMVEGQAVGRQLSLREALEVIQPLAQLLYFLELKGLTLVDIEPRSLLQTQQGLRLIPPPRLARIGDRTQPIWREGYTPPEVLAESTARSKTGVYLVGALFYELLTGTALPVEGASDLLLMGIPLAGVPQTLSQMLDSLDERATPGQAMALLKGLALPPEPVFEIGAFTSVGLNSTRHFNEDAYSYRFERIKTQWNSTLLLRACVSDGMGGMASGEVASQAAVETFVSGVPPHPLDDPQAQAEWAIRLVWDANTEVIESLAGKDGGCTISSVMFVGARFALAHVGDTRAYLWNSQGLKQLSRDHSLVAMLVSSGMITPEEAQHHPDRNKVLRSLGNVRQPQEDYVDSLKATMGTPTMVLNPGEILLLVSDGVWGEVEDKRMAEIIAASSAEPQKIAEALVQAAIDSGAPDNATALLIRRRS